MIKTVILCGGKGTRLSEETVTIPKPMVRIGGIPILTHIMKSYEYYGYSDFVLCLGYKQEIIKDYFLNYVYYDNDVWINLLSAQRRAVLGEVDNDIQVVLANTGLDTLTGDRLLQVRNYVEEDNEDIFLLTYGDGVSDINIEEVVEFHRSHNKMCTLTAVQNRGKFGALQIQGESSVTSFREKQVEEDYINGGFFVMDTKIFDYIKPGDLTETLEYLATANELACYKHHGFWKCMDTINDKNELEKLWKSGAGWKGGE